MFKFATRRNSSLQKMALEKLSVFAYVISRKRSVNQQNQLRNDAVYVKTSQSAKIALDPAKIKIDPKCYIRPFECTKAFN